MSSPLKGVGHAGPRSAKKSTIDRLNLHTAKLVSPMKRSMTELNKLAYETAIRNKPSITDDMDSIALNEQSILDEIILLSKEDPMNSLNLEEEDLYLSKDLKKMKHNNPTRTPEKSLAKEIPPLNINTENLHTNDCVKEQKTPVKTDKYEAADVTPLRRSSRQRISVLDKLQNASDEISSRSPRKTRNLHSKFNNMNDIAPKNAKRIKLMKIPIVDTTDDELLTFNSVSKQKALYHDGFEAYFEQSENRSKTSKKSMTNAPEISYEEYNQYNKLLDLICTEPIKSLNKLYAFQFSQWQFELQEGFNLIFYGIGSKRRLLLSFLQDFILPMQTTAKCVVINGYNTEFNLRLLMREIWKICFKKPLPSSRETRETCNITHIEFMKSSSRNNKLYILLNNIDGESLRNDDLQYMLSQLALIKQVSLICTMDNVNMPIFWDASVLSNFNFIWHNTSTFESYFTEVSFRDPLSIGKTDQLLGSRGAKYVLSSLTGNAKNLYKNLILQQLEKIDTYIGDDVKLLDNRGNIKGSVKTCTPLREFYEICVSEFIISNDISFRTILGEFVEHKMCNLVRDSSGIEVLFISFTVDEMEKLLDQELMD